MQNLPRYVLGWCLILLFTLLTACGGTKNNSTKSSAASSSTGSLSSASSSVVVNNPVLLTGVITYDYVPHNNVTGGLNYLAIEPRAVRGAAIEIIDGNGANLGSSVTSNDGSYSFSVPQNTLLKVRVKAQLLNNTPPNWDFKVTDNTNNNALYTLVGSLASTGISHSQRNLRALSGWGGSSYSATRSAAPFAILDNIYHAVNRLNEAGNVNNLTPLELRWSTKNNEADNDYTLGEIGTTFYDGTAIYILGDANNDTDEFDSHVILHEWGHYVENNLSRSDSIGGAHSDGEKLDMRVSMSEGFANAFSAMMLNDPNYADSSGSAQNSGFVIPINKKTRTEKGFFSEGSVGSIFYNYYHSSTNKIADDFTPIFSVLSDSNYFTHEAMTSIFLFYGQLKTSFSDQAIEFNSLMQEQHIFGVNEYAENETNSGGLAINLPVYKSITPNDFAVNVCSTPEFGEFNKLGNSQFLKLTLTQTGNYSINVTKFGGADAPSKPEIIVYKKGISILNVKNLFTNSVSGNINVESGIYIIEVYDSSSSILNTFCFDVRVIAN